MALFFVVGLIVGVFVGFTYLKFAAKQRGLSMELRTRNFTIVKIGSEIEKNYSRIFFILPGYKDFFNVTISGSNVMIDSSESISSLARINVGNAIIEVKVYDVNGALIAKGKASISSYEKHVKVPISWIKGGTPERVELDIAPSK